jgi:hypothetical protein
VLLRGKEGRGNRANDFDVDRHDSLDTIDRPHVDLAQCGPDGWRREVES